MNKEKSCISTIVEPQPKIPQVDAGMDDSSDTKSEKESDNDVIDRFTINSIF